MNGLPCAMHWYNSLMRIFRQLSHAMVLEFKYRYKEARKISAVSWKRVKKIANYILQLE